MDISKELADKQLYVVRGLPMSVHFKKQFVEETLDYEPRDGDVIIASYPKTGTTWISYIVHQILTTGDSLPNTDEMLNKTVPFMEMTGTAAIDALTAKPRVYKHHFPYDKVRKNPNAKYIYIYRRPEDTFVSYYHFLRHNNTALDFDQYFEDFLSGIASYGDYFDHVLSFLKHKDDSNMFMVSYESLHANTKGEIIRIAKFLGEEYYNKVADDEEVLKQIMERTSFDYMKKTLAGNAATPRKEVFPVKTRDASQFFRKGVVGDGKKELTSNQFERLRKHAEDKMKGTEVLLEWNLGK